jgi:FixJ family two-component response regulator
MLVSVIDDDQSVRESLPDLLRELGYSADVYASADEFLAAESMRQTQCLILDIFMHGMSGPELMKELAIRKFKVAVIFVTAHFDESLRSRLIEEGAVDCLFKPFSDQALSSALCAAVRAAPPSPIPGRDM